MGVYTNDDGLTIAMHRDEGEAQAVGASGDNTENHKAIATLEVGSALFDGTTGTHSLDPLRVAEIPSGSHILSAEVHVEESFTSAGAATVALGLENGSGVAIDADGILTATAIASLAEGDVVDGDGALIAAADLSADGHVTVTVATAALTAGKLRLVVNYR